jgi:hypothetical protein
MDWVRRETDGHAEIDGTAVLLLCGTPDVRIGRSGPYRDAIGIADGGISDGSGEHISRAGYTRMMRRVTRDMIVVSMWLIGAGTRSVAVGEGKVRGRIFQSLATAL